MKLSDVQLRDEALTGLHDVDLDMMTTISELEIYSATYRHERVMLLRKKFKVLSDAIDTKYRLLREQAEMKEDIGWVLLRRALQGVE